MEATDQQFPAHGAVQRELTKDDFRRAAAGDPVVKTVYLPKDVSSGTPLLVLRLGNRDQEVPEAPGKE
jgi:hypothetical protein